MGLSAYLFGRGPFSPEVQDVLEYYRDHYRDLEPGTEVYVTCFRCPSTRASKDLAAVFGTSPMDFGRHPALKPDEDVLARLKSFAADYGYREEEYDRFVALVAGGFTFCYIPNMSPAA